jgi:hypothetical protein
MSDIRSCRPRRKTDWVLLALLVYSVLTDNEKIASVVSTLLTTMGM